MSTQVDRLLNLEGIPKNAGYRVAIVATEWNSEIVHEQIAGARRIAEQMGVEIRPILYVPGSVEIPFVIRRMYEVSSETGSMPDAVIAFGAVIRGDTPHFDYVCKMLTDGLHILNMSLPIPVIFGVLTIDNESQVWERLGRGAHGHKGEEAMISAIKMIHLNKSL